MCEDEIHRQKVICYSSRKSDFKLPKSWFGSQVEYPLKAKATRDVYSVLFSFFVFLRCAIAIKDPQHERKTDSCKGRDTRILGVFLFRANEKVKWIPMIGKRYAAKNLCRTVVQMVAPLENAVTLNGLGPLASGMHFRFASIKHRGRQTSLRSFSWIAQCLPENCACIKGRGLFRFWSFQPLHPYL